MDFASASTERNAAIEINSPLLQELDDYINATLDLNDDEKLFQFYQTFKVQDEFILIPKFFSKDVVKKFFVPEANLLQNNVKRSYMPLTKKHGIVNSYLIVKDAPALNFLYHNQKFIEYLKRITNEENFFECPPQDPEGMSLYYYEEPGDYFAWHYDTSYYQGNRFTVLLGIIDDHQSESCKLVCQLYSTTERESQLRVVILHPGDLVLFNGDRVLHCVTPMTDGGRQKRVVLSLEYISDAGMTLWQRASSTFKDAVTYFGLGYLFGF